MSNEAEALLKREMEIRTQMAEYNLATADLRVQIECNQREVCRLSRELTEIHSKFAQLEEKEVTL